MKPGIGKLFMWSNNDVRTVIELIPFPILKFQTN